MYTYETGGLKNTLNVRPQNEIDDIIGNPPSWILYSGIIIIGCFVVMFYLMAAFIKYPDKLSASIILTTENPAIKVYSEVGGKVELLFTEDQDSVQKDQNILLFESDVNWKDLVLFKSSISELDSHSTYVSHQVPSFLYLGQLQESYSALIQKLNEYEYLTNTQDLASNISQIKGQIIYFDQLNESIIKQNKILEKEVVIVKNKYEIHEGLFVNGAISKQEVEEIKQNFLSSQRQLENKQAQVLNNKIKIEQLKIRVSELLQSDKNQKFETKLSIENLLRKLKNEIALWERQHLIKAPIDGILSLSKIWSTNQSIKTEEAIFTVIPFEISEPILARAQMPVYGIGKIRIGTKANVRISGFPEQEFGILKCSVHTISLFPDTENNQDPYYLIELSLDNGLVTSYNKVIPMQHEMSGNAELITEDKSILQRIVNQSFDIFKNQ